MPASFGAGILSFLMAPRQLDKMLFSALFLPFTSPRHGSFLALSFRSRYNQPMLTEFSDALLQEALSDPARLAELIDASRGLILPALERAGTPASLESLLAFPRALSLAHILSRFDLDERQQALLQPFFRQALPEQAEAQRSLHQRSALAEVSHAGSPSPSTHGHDPASLSAEKALEAGLLPRPGSRLSLDQISRHRSVLLELHDAHESDLDKILVASSQDWTPETLWTQLGPSILADFHCLIEQREDALSFPPIRSFWIDQARSLSVREGRPLRLAFFRHLRLSETDRPLLEEFLSSRAADSRDPIPYRELELIPGASALISPIQLALRWSPSRLEDIPEDQALASIGSLRQAWLASLEQRISKDRSRGSVWQELVSIHAPLSVFRALLSDELILRLSELSGSRRGGLGFESFYQEDSDSIAKIQALRLAAFHLGSRLALSDPEHPLAEVGSLIRLSRELLSPWRGSRPDEPQMEILASGLIGLIEACSEARDPRFASLWDSLDDLLSEALISRLLDRVDSLSSRSLSFLSLAAATRIQSLSSSRSMDSLGSRRSLSRLLLRALPFTPSLSARAARRLARQTDPDLFETIPPESASPVPALAPTAARLALSLRALVSDRQARSLSTSDGSNVSTSSFPSSSSDSDSFDLLSLPPADFLQLPLGLMLARARLDPRLPSLCKASGADPLTRPDFVARMALSDSRWQRGWAGRLLRPLGDQLLSWSPELARQLQSRPELSHLHRIGASSDPSLLVARLEPLLESLDRLDQLDSDLSSWRDTSESSSRFGWGSSSDLSASRKAQIQALGLHDLFALGGSILSGSAPSKPLYLESYALSDRLRALHKELSSQALDLTLPLSPSQIDSALLGWLRLGRVDLFESARALLSGPPRDALFNQWARSLSITELSSLLSKSRPFVFALARRASKSLSSSSQDKTPPLDLDFGSFELNLQAAFLIERAFSTMGSSRALDERAQMALQALSPSARSGCSNEFLSALTPRSIFHSWSMAPSERASNPLVSRPYSLSQILSAWDAAEALPGGILGYHDVNAGLDTLWRSQFESRPEELRALLEASKSRPLLHLSLAKRDLLLTLAPERPGSVPDRELFCAQAACAFFDIDALCEALADLRSRLDRSEALEDERHPERVNRALVKKLIHQPTWLFHAEISNPQGGPDLIRSDLSPSDSEKLLASYLRHFPTIAMTLGALGSIPSVSEHLERHFGAFIADPREALSIILPPDSCVWESVPSEGYQRDRLRASLRGFLHWAASSRPQDCQALDWLFSNREFISDEIDWEHRPRRSKGSAEIYFDLLDLLFEEPDLRDALRVGLERAQFLGLSSSRLAPKPRSRSRI